MNHPSWLNNLSGRLRPAILVWATLTPTLVTADTPSARPATAGASAIISCGDEHHAALYSEIFRRDQGARESYTAAYQSQRLHGAAADGPDRLELARLEQVMRENDEANQAALDGIVALCGWPEGGFEGSVEAAFLTVHHAPLGYQLRYLEKVRASHTRGDIPQHVFRLFEQRLAARTGAGPSIQP